MGRTRLWIGVAVVLAASLLALHESLRAGFASPVSSATSLLRWIEAVAVGAVLAGLVALVAVVLVRRHYRQTLRELGQRVSTLRASPSSLSMHSPLGREPAAEEWLFLWAEVEALVSSYRNALDEIVKAQEALENLRSQAENAGAHKGRGDSQPPRSNFLRSSRMIARLAPNLHWIAATAVLQQFLGRTMADLNARPFLAGVHQEDVPVVRQALQEALQEGEGHNINFRMLLASRAVRHLQMDVLTRYTAEGLPLHLRCHFVDRTDQVQAAEALSLQSFKLTQANALLLQSNEGLQRLKESYRDLYHKAPVLYFSLDPRGHFAACNDTMLMALGYERSDLLGQPYTRVLTPEGSRRFLEDPSSYQKVGEIEARWVTKTGHVIDVWVRTAPILDPQGHFVRSRSAAQDVTERNRLANALRTKALELQLTNDHLRRTNQELEEFTYVVSHDLKEPLRTLEAFSTFLQQDYGESLGAEGRDFIAHLIEASRRLGRLIDDLLALSRAG
jgi:PAS domain S-box-containing protein